MAQFGRMKKGILIGLVLCLVVVGFLFLGGGGEERAIEKRLDALVEQVEKDGPASKFEAVGRARKVVEFFAPEADVEYYPRRRLPRDLDSMQGAFIQAWDSLDTATVWIQQHKVELDASEENAVSTFRATSQVKMNGEQDMSDTIPYRIEWVKLDGEWKIARVEANYVP